MLHSVRAAKRSCRAVFAPHSVRAAQCVSSDSSALVKATAFAAATVVAVSCFAEMSASCAEMESRDGVAIIERCASDRPSIGKAYQCLAKCPYPVLTGFVYWVFMGCGCE